MRSSDQTLLAKLGFDDPDKRDNKHDLACQYVSHIKDKLFSHFIPDYVGDVNSTLEMPVHKGAKQYKSLVGFLDVVLYVGGKKTAPVVNARNGYSRPGLANNVIITYIQECHVFKKHVVFEIKTNPVSVGAILAQMNVYKEHHINLSLDGIEKYNGEWLFAEGNIVKLDPVWVVATTFKMKELDRNTLENEGIKHIHLGAPFDEFCKTHGPEDSSSKSW